MVIFIEFLKALDVSMCVQCRTVLLFLDNYAPHLQDTSFVWSVKVVYYSPNCTNMLQPLDLGIIKCFKQYYRKQLVQKVVYCMDSGKDIEFKISVFQAIHFTVVVWE
jgi:hypothetical protein